MKFSDYQQQAAATAIYPEPLKGFYPLLGLMGETCELIEKILGGNPLNPLEPDNSGFEFSTKLDSTVLSSLLTLGFICNSGAQIETNKKILRKNGLQNGEAFPMPVLTDEQKTLIKKEMGDCFWYLAAIARDLDIDLDEVAQMNLDKLRSRQERGTLEGSGDNR